MIVLYCRPGCPRCASLHGMLERLALKSRLVEVGPDEQLPDDLPEDTALRDGEELYTGGAAVAEHLDELEVFKEWWYKFQSDACYCDESGEVITQPKSDESGR
ncbi:MAG: hypothetical protein ACOC7T_04935 [Planctomycetota bacterium]